MSSASVSSWSNDASSSKETPSSVTRRTTYPSSRGSMVASARRLKMTVLRLRVIQLRRLRAPAPMPGSGAAARRQRIVAGRGIARLTGGATGRQKRRRRRQRKRSAATCRRRAGRQPAPQHPARDGNSPEHPGYRLPPDDRRTLREGRTGCGKRSGHRSISAPPSRAPSAIPARSWMAWRKLHACAAPDIASRACALLGGVRNRAPAGPE